MFSEELENLQAPDTNLKACSFLWKLKIVS